MEMIPDPFSYRKFPFVSHVLPCQPGEAGISEPVWQGQLLPAGGRWAAACNTHPSQVDRASEAPLMLGALEPDR